MIKALPPVRKLILASLLICLALSACSPAAPQQTTLEVRSDYPPTAVALGERFSVVVTISNTGQFNAQVSQILLPLSFLTQARFDGSSPELSVETEASGDVTLITDWTIAPGGVEVLTLYFRTAQPGSAYGLGTVVSNAGNYQFHLRAEVQAGMPPASAPTAVVPANQPTPAVNLPPTVEPSPVPTATAAPEFKVPYRAVVQIKAMVEVGGAYVVGWTGSGTIISSDGLILTSSYAALSDEFNQVQEIVVALNDGPNTPAVAVFYADVVQADPGLGYAVLKVRARMNGNPVDHASLTLPKVPLGNSDTVNAGDELMIVGYPGFDNPVLADALTTVTAIRADDFGNERAYFDIVSTFAGEFSGGLVLNKNGRLVGIAAQTDYTDPNDNPNCRRIADTNSDGAINASDWCVPTGGLITSLRPLKLAMALIDDAKAGLVMPNLNTLIEEPVEEPLGITSFTDNFSDPSTGWALNNTELGKVRYQDGELWIDVDKDRQVILSTIDIVADEVFMGVDARIINGGGFVELGFVCGFQDTLNLTTLTITEDGYYQISKWVDGTQKRLLDWTISDLVLAGGPYKLSASCSQEKLMLLLGETVLAEYVDPDYKPGKLGLLAATFVESGIRVGFDNFVAIYE